MRKQLIIYIKVGNTQLYYIVIFWETESFKRLFISSRRCDPWPGVWYWRDASLLLELIRITWVLVPLWNLCRVSRWTE